MKGLVNMDQAVRYFVSDKYPVSKNERFILERMAGLPVVQKPVVALPDLHFKSSYHTPTGVVVLARDAIIPKFVNPNCGMSVIVTPFFNNEFSEEKISKIFFYIKSRISVALRENPFISLVDLGGIVKNGARWTIDKYGLNCEDSENFDNKGSLFYGNNISAEKILSFVPDVCRQIGLRSMGVLGYGNHFIEMQYADQIMDEDCAGRFGIAKGQICFIVHGDSRDFGRSIFDFYSKKAKRVMGLEQLYKKIHYRLLSSGISEKNKKFVKNFNYYANRIKSLVYWKTSFMKCLTRQSFPIIRSDSAEGIAYKISTYAALNYAYANRAYIAVAIRDALRDVFGAEKAGVQILLDSSHDSVQEENIDGQLYWVHRNGASRALPSRFYRDHKIFGSTGQPVLLPSALGKPSYLCAALEGCPDSYYSVSHGTGRVIDRGEARYAFNQKTVLSEIAAKGVKVFDYGSGCVAEESPQAFKEIEAILEVIEKNKIARRALRLKPMASLKGWL